MQRGTKQCRIKVYSGMVETLQRARSSLFWQRGPARVSTVSEYEALSEWRNGQRINSARWAAMPSGRRRSDDVVVSGTGVMRFVGTGISTFGGVEVLPVFWYSGRIARKYGFNWLTWRDSTPVEWRVDRIPKYEAFGSARTHSQS
jgi:hypothetical protein